MWKKLSYFAESSASSLLLAGLCALCAVLHFGNFIGRRIDER